ncbi:succinate dehydrogenase, cytochrome b556 subunit [Cryptococcus bacillisporus CA1873]|uniref:Succinate dehydrogenase, cytochrome b556 subunit n=1 Tax=Cryptococcus bacillisporus CA1873 TaxID=1296111 RepID=A0ABR5BDZ0_CRYGA|nr:succinate dehydrogenase, cytochrome b556 subunit [Cryptococcus bacillisporus CA1873]|eukprot:KIR67411.1 succinate dehydrogenase, cytochrome b556 subunit [Cryptococcus gattii CA1873]
MEKVLTMNRLVSTQPMTDAEDITLLNSQRQHRPTSPHLAIYQPQLTWYLSSLHRITGVAFGGALYLSAMAYLLHPLVPGIDSAHLIQLVHDLPGWLKGSAKFIIALPFTFHCYNGLRHLNWDIGKALTIKGVYRTGYAVLGATVLSSLYLAFFI